MAGPIETANLIVQTDWATSDEVRAANLVVQVEWSATLVGQIDVANLVVQVEWGVFDEVKVANLITQVEWSAFTPIIPPPAPPEPLTPFYRNTRQTRPTIVTTQHINTNPNNVVPAGVRVKNNMSIAPLIHIDDKGERVLYRDRATKVVNKV